jgi:hypothetical protein
MPVAPQVLQDLLLAKRACFELGSAGEVIELWEAYALAQIDAPYLIGELDGLSGTISASLQKKLATVRGDSIPLVEYLRQALPGTLPLLDDPKALDLALVFIMSTPPARDAVIRWFKSPAGSRDEAMKLLNKIGRMVEAYRKAISEAEGAGPAPSPTPAPKTPPASEDETERLLQERINAQRKSREKSITEQGPKEKEDADRLSRLAQEKEAAERAARLREEQERLAKEKEEAGKAAQVKAEAEQISREKAQAEHLAREKAEAERLAKAKSEAERMAREKAEAVKKAQEERIAREKAEAERIANEKAEAERLAKAKAEVERMAREKAEAAKKAEEERIAREKAEKERIVREKAEAERIAREKAEAERLAKAKEEAERIARERAEAERIAREKAEAAKKANEERIAREKAERERIAREKAEAERIAREKAEAERIAKAKAEAERIAREKAEAERIAREKAEAERRAREKADAALTPEQLESRDKARVELRARMPILLADPWAELKVGAWFRVKSVAGKDETLTDTGLRERGKGYSMLGVQKCVGGRAEWENMERVQTLTVQPSGQEMVELGGTLLDCDVYQITSKAGVEKLWTLLDGPHAGAPIKSEAPTGSFTARKLEKETLAVGAKSFECTRMEGEETVGGKRADATRWWSLAYPLGPIKSTSAAAQLETVRAGDSWGNRPPLP